MMSKMELTEQVQELWKAVQDLQAGSTEVRAKKTYTEHRLMTPREASSHYRVGRRRLMTLVDKGTIPAIQQPTSTGNGCRWMLRREDCDAALDVPCKPIAGRGYA